MLLLDRSDWARALSFSDLDFDAPPTPEEITATVERIATEYGSADALLAQQITNYCSFEPGPYLKRMRCACNLLDTVFPDGIPAD